MRTFIEGTENHKRESHHWRAECGESRTLRSAGARRKRSCKTTSSAGYPTARAIEKALANGSVAKHARGAHGCGRLWLRPRMQRLIARNPTFLLNIIVSFFDEAGRRRRLPWDIACWSSFITS